MPDYYDETTTYIKGECCIYRGFIVKSKVDNNLGNTPPSYPLLANDYWIIEEVDF